MQCTVHHGLVGWRPTVWPPLYNGINNGQIVNMSFTKSQSDTYLRLTWSSNMRQLVDGKCSQWYFMMNGEECTSPQPINANIHHQNLSTPGKVANIHRHSTIIGVCKATSSGPLQAASYLISINVRDCPDKRYRDADANTGWASPSTMIVEELCPPNDT